MFKHAPLYTAAFLSIAPATWAQADITAQDVLNNFQAYANAFGATFTPNATTNAADTTLSKATFAASLSVPTALTGGVDLGTFSVSVTLPDYTLTNNTDGTVTLTSPENSTMNATFSMPEMDPFVIPMTIQSQGVKTLASGTPGDITYTYRADQVTVTSDFEMPSELADGFDTAPNFALDVAQNNVSGEFRVTEGAILKVKGQSFVGEISQQVKTGLPDGDANSETSSLTRDQEVVLDVSLPTGDTSVFNLAKALRAGLQFDADISYGSFEQTEAVTVTQDIATKTQVATGASTTKAALSEAGMNVDGKAADIALSLEMPFVVPVPMSFDADAVSIAMQLPLLKSDSAEAFGYKTQLTNVTIGDAVWGMFDPTAQLPRDPAQLSIDLSGALQHNVEWLDFLSVEDSFAALAGLPIDPKEVSINALSLSAAGAQIDAKGAFAFDAGDLATYPGMPRPDGRITVDVKGLTGLMDTLIAMGLLPEEQAMGVRMMLGGFTKQVAEDHVTSTVVMTPEGHITANGQRLK